MSVDHYYHLCNKNIGVPVEVKCHDGTVHRGIIDRVERDRLFLRPLDGAAGGHGVYFWGFGLAGFGAGIALGSIATLAFLPWGWW